MLSVEQAVCALRREIFAALADKVASPAGGSWVADRVCVSLAVRLGPVDAAGPTGCFVVATEPGPGLHQVTVEFRLAPAAPAASCPASIGEPPTSVAGAEGGAEPPILAALAEVFGAPGFDSSARATVFREALEELSEGQRRRVLGSLGDPPSPDEETAVTHAQHLVLRLVASGPAGRERGTGLLRDLAAKHTADELIQAAAERWRTQSEWAASRGLSPLPRGESLT